MQKKHCITGLPKNCRSLNSCLKKISNHFWSLQITAY